MRKTCKQSKDNNPNWLGKITLPELKRIELNFTECLSDSNDKVLKFIDNILFDGKKIVSYSSEVVN